MYFARPGLPARRSLLIGFTAVLLPLLATGCASSGGGKPVAHAARTDADARAACVPALGDSTLAEFAAYAPFYRACEVDRPARMVPPPPGAARVDAAESMGRRPQTSCQSVKFQVIVDEQGRPIPATARVVHSTSMAFAQSALRDLPTMRYEPARKDGRPVRQVTDFGKMVSTSVGSPGGPATRPGRC